MTYTHKIDADKILTMGKGARKTWRTLGLPESAEAQRATVHNAWGYPRERATARRLREAGIHHDTLSRIEPSSPDDLAEFWETPGLYDHLKD